MNIFLGLNGQPAFSQKLRNRYKQMQESVPAGELILAKLENNFLLDFKRNPVYIMDFPGGSSLPPGLPVFQGSEAVADYLLSKNIRYVAFSRHMIQSILYRNDHRVGQYWVETQMSLLHDFKDNLRRLRYVRRELYSDPDLVVIDLALKREGV